MQAARVGWAAPEAERMEPEAVRYAKPTEEDDGEHEGDYSLGGRAVIPHLVATVLGPSALARSKRVRGAGGPCVRRGRLRRRRSSLGLGIGGTGRRRLGRGRRRGLSRLRRDGLLAGASALGCGRSAAGASRGDCSQRRSNPLRLTAGRSGRRRRGSGRGSG